VASAEENIVLKYCEILDEFIRVRATSEDDSPRLLKGADVRSRAAYHQLVVSLCVVDFERQVLPLFERHNKVYQSEALVELLYQVCIEVNPHLEIHSVTLPTGTSGTAGPVGTAAGEDESGKQEEERRALQRRVLGIEGALATAVIGQCARSARR